MDWKQNKKQQHFSVNVMNKIIFKSYTSTVFHGTLTTLHSFYIIFTLIEHILRNDKRHINNITKCFSNSQIFLEEYARALQKRQRWHNSKVVWTLNPCNFCSNSKIQAIYWNVLSVRSCIHNSINLQGLNLTGYKLCKVTQHSILSSCIVMWSFCFKRIH